MPGFIITQDAQLVCPHVTGTAQAVSPDPRVSISGSPIMTVQREYLIGSCPDTNSHCISASWQSGAQKVTASGLAVAIASGTSVVKPAGVLTVQRVQAKVSAS